MAAPHPDNSAFHHHPHRLAASESAALGLPVEDGDYDHADTHNHNDTNNYTPSPTPPPPESLTRLNRTEYEEQIEKTERLDEVEPGLSYFRAQRELHIRQLKDLNKRSNMVNSRIDKINDDVEKLRQQWGNLEREKAGLLVTSERYEQMMEKQEAIVRKDDATGVKYHAYLTLNSEVLVLDDDEDEDTDRPMHDWGVNGHGGGDGGEEYE